VVFKIRVSFCKKRDSNVNGPYTRVAKDN